MAPILSTLQYGGKKGAFHIFGLGIIEFIGAEAMVHGGTVFKIVSPLS